MAKKAQDGLGYYYREGKKYCWRLKQGDRVVAVVKRNSAAERDAEVRARQKALKESGVVQVAGQEPTLLQHLNHWLEIRIKPNRARSTYLSYEQTVRNYIKPHPIGKKKITRLTSLDIQSLVAKMQSDGLSGRTIELAVTVICASVGRHAAMALKDGLLLPKKNGARERVLAPCDMGEFFEELYREQVFTSREGSRFVYRDRHLITALLNLGVRINEALGIQMSAVDLEARTVSIVAQLDRYTEKGRAQWDLADLKTTASKRVLALNDEALAAIKGQIAQVAQDRLLAGDGYETNGLLFATASGRPHSDRNVRRTLEHVCTAINKRRDEANLDRIPNLSLHDLRHTYLTQLARVEKRAQVLKTIAGHSNISTTFGVYIHAERDDVREAASLVSFGRKVQG